MSVVQSIFFPIVFPFAIDILFGGDPFSKMLGTAAQAIGEQSVSLSNDDVLVWNITQPSMNSTTFYLNKGVSIMNLTFQGNARISLSVPDVNYIYIMDTSKSTSYPASCGTILGCVQEVFSRLHRAVNVAGSAKLVSLITFNNEAKILYRLQDPSQAISFTTINNVAIVPKGSTHCSDALEKAVEIIEDSENTANNTVVFFAGDGMCSDAVELNANISYYADKLGATGATVYTIDTSTETYYNNSNNEAIWIHHDYLPEIPRNGGVCFSVSDSSIVSTYLDGVVDSDLSSFELKIDGDKYVQMETFNSAAIYGVEWLVFSKFAQGITKGIHEVCIRIKTQNCMGSFSVEDCRDIIIKAPSIISLFHELIGGSSSIGKVIILLGGLCVGAAIVLLVKKTSVK